MAVVFCVSRWIRGLNLEGKNWHNVRPFEMEGAMTYLYIATVPRPINLCL